MRKSNTALLGAIAAIFVAVAPAVSASAHNYPIAETPEAGTVVTEQPGTFVLETNDVLIDIGNSTAMTVTDADGLYYGDGCASILNRAVQMDGVLGQPGEYAVSWQVVSTDGHPISDSWTFMWAPAEGEVLGEGARQAPVCASDEPDEESAVVSTPGDSETTTTDADATGSSDVLWLAGGIGGAALVALVTWWLLARRRPE